MTNTKTFVDPLGPVKTWLRAQSVAGVGQRVYIGDPERATLPYIEIMLVDAPTDPGETPVVETHVQCVVQAATEGDAATSVWDLVSKVESIGAVNLDATLRCVGARRVLGPVPRVDEAGPRYLVEFAFCVVAR